MEELLKKYSFELKNKIKLKGIANKTDKQILYQAFKYLDKNTSGFCNYTTFLIINQKFDVILSEEEFQKLFFYFDKNNEKLINYNDFINVIINKENKEQNLSNKSINTNNLVFKGIKENKTINNNIDNIPLYKKPFFQKIKYYLINNEIGPNIILLILYQEFILADKDLTGKLTLNEFVKIINDNKINLSIGDIQMLLREYGLNNDGNFYYDNMIEDLINIFINNQRKKIITKKSEEIFEILNKKEKMNINSLQNIINIPEVYYKFFNNNLNIIEPNEYYNEIIKKYIGLKRVSNIPRNSLITKDNIEEILNYISFGIENNDIFEKAIDIIFLNKEVSIIKNYNEINYNKNKNGEKNIKKYEINDEFWYELRKYFIKVGIINFLNLIKNFQFYDRGNNIIEIKNFIKILNDFEINIDDELLDKTFYIFSKDNNLTINYIYFISQLIDKFINDEIIKLIENIYESIKIYCLNIKGKSFDFEFFKKNIYNENNQDIFNIFELFHYNFYEKYKQDNYYLNKKDIYDLINEKNATTNIIKIEKDEFIYFYKFIYFFNNIKINFKDIIYSNWKKILLNSKIKNNNIYNNKEPEVVLKLKKKLRKRGLRGVMNLHKQFIISCKDLSLISFQLFQNIFAYQRLSLSNEELIKIFSLFKTPDNYLNFAKFIRTFKKRLNEKRLQSVEDAFSKLDINQNNKVDINYIKIKYNEKNDIRVLNGKNDEEEILCEFLDCFDLNYYLLINKDNHRSENEYDWINFEEFANFYEYVSFLYENDNDFIQLVHNSWNL